MTDKNHNINQKIHNIEQEFNKALNIVKNNLEISFSLMERYPEQEKEIIDIWTNHIQKIIQIATVMSEKNNNKKLIKAITKSIILGR